MKRLLLALALSLAALSAAPVFEFNDGDRVAFLGDSLMEREQYGGWIELAATTQFPDRDVTFRNLGWSADTPAGVSRNGLCLVQAGQEAADEGWKQLLKQLGTYNPNVIVLGYGMAASLPGGSSPEDFGKNLERLLDEAPGAAGGDTRFLILEAPPYCKQNFDDAESAASRAESLVEINGILKATAEKRGIPFVPLAGLGIDPAFSQDGIHLTEAGYKAVARLLEKSLGWEAKPWDTGGKAELLRQHILKKNQWFFNRSRPANMAYIFGFRSKEQGNNAKEIPQFDALVAKEEAYIAKMRDLSTETTVPLEPVHTASAVAANTPQPHPNFTVADGFEVALWAENPLLHKPTQINFDPQGRLWVASSETYPMVEVGQTADDKIIVIEDTDGDGTADKSTVFAGGMMMPTAVLPGDGGAYVAQSTDLLHFKDTDGDGMAEVKTRVLSGFGTEDTHHNLHTLRRGPDGRIWMNQSVYTRSDVETPHGIVRLKSGGVFRFDPRDASLEVVYRGFWNTWGHQFDKYGQSFLTDGAGFTGINWGMPGATYQAYAGATEVLGGISPGSYPKFSGIEIIESPQFPEDWQGNIITCDFRAHRIVRFSIADDGAGYVTQELDDLLRSDDVSFRPIDVKTGPDGALYIADWSNPIINHGEVDFRDPRRDREHGRIWRISKKGAAPGVTKDFRKRSPEELAAALASGIRYDREQATAVLFERKEKPILPTGSEAEILAALRFGNTSPELIGKALASPSGELRSTAIRSLADSAMTDEARLSLLKKAIADPFPRVRLEAVVALAKIPGADSLDITLKVLGHPIDRFIEYALWMAIRSDGSAWLAAFAGEKIDLTENPGTLEYVLSKLPPEVAATTLSENFPEALPADGSGPWLSLGLKLGGENILPIIFQQAASGGLDEKTTLSAFDGIATAIAERQVKWSGETATLVPFIEKGNPSAIRLAGATGDENLIPTLAATAAKSSGEIRLTTISALANFKAPAARDAIAPFTAEKEEPALRQHAALALARNFRDTALPLIVSLASDISEPETSRTFWQKALSNQGISAQLAKAFTAKPLSEKSAALALQHIPDVKDHDALLTVLRTQAGASGAETYGPEKIAALAASSKEKGDPHRGELIYRNPALACTACHAIAGAGGKIGPDMTSIGASAPLDYLVESVVNPGSKVKEGYHSVIIETKDGKAINGALLRSTGGSTVLRDASGAEVTIPDNMIAKKTDAGSLMPSNLINSLDPQQTADLFAFLSQLGRPGDFSANDSQAPRTYAVLESSPETETRASSGDPSLPWTKFSATVNGSLLPAEVKAIIPNWNQEEMFVGTKIQLSEASELSLILPAGLKPTALWIDGKSAMTGKASLAAGIHFIVMRTHIKETPIRFQSAKGTFLPEW